MTNCIWTRKIELHFFIMKIENSIYIYELNNMNAFPPKHLQVVPRHNHGDRIKLLCLRSCGSTLVENQICFKKLSITKLLLPRNSVIVLSSQW